MQAGVLRAGERACEQSAAGLRKYQAELRHIIDRRMKLAPLPPRVIAMLRYFCCSHGEASKTATWACCHWSFSAAGASTIVDPSGLTTTLPGAIAPAEDVLVAEPSPEGSGWPSRDGGPSTNGCALLPVPSVECRARESVRWS